MTKLKDLKLDDEVGEGGGAIDDSIESAVTTYSSEKIKQEIENSVRGVAVFVSATEPPVKQTNDIWIKI